MQMWVRSCNVMVQKQQIKQKNEIEVAQNAANR